MADSFATNRSGLESPGEHAASVTPADGSDLSTHSRALFVGGAGNIAVVMAGGESLTFTGVVAGTVLPIRVARVKSTGTTATNIVAIW